MTYMDHIAVNVDQFVRRKGVSKFTKDGKIGWLCYMAFLEWYGTSYIRFGL